MIDSLSLASHFKPFTRPPSKIIFPVKFHRLSAWDAFTGHPRGRTVQHRKVSMLEIAILIGPETMGHPSWSSLRSRIKGV